jgi:hypothetical protein
MNRALFFNDKYGNTTIHSTAAPRMWGSISPVPPYPNYWAFEHRSAVFAGGGTTQTGTKPKLETTDYGVYGYNLSAQWSPDEGDVEPFAVPYAPRQVQCRYDTHAGVRLPLCLVG